MYRKIVLSYSICTLLQFLTGTFVCFQVVHSWIVLGDTRLAGAGHRPCRPRRHVIAWRRGCKVCTIPLLTTHQIYCKQYRGCKVCAELKIRCFTYVSRDVCHIIRCQCHIGNLIRCRSHIADLLRCGTHNSDVEMVKCELGFCYDCPSEKVSQKFLRISVEKMRDFFLFFALKKSLSGTETVARRVSSRELGKYHLRALYSFLPQAAKLALSKKLKHHEASMIKECLQQFKGPKKGKVFQLCRMHWVSIC